MLLRGFATVGSLTAVSRLLGFLRDILIAAALGTGPVADAFFVAFRFPNLFRRLFAEGAFNAAFVPLFAARLEQDGKAAAKLFAEEALAVLAAGLLIFTALCLIAMPWLMQIMAPGFLDDPEQFALAVELTRITFPYLLAMALVALFSGVLNALYRYAVAAAAPILLNLFFIGAITLILPHFRDQPGQVLAWTVAAAGLGQLLLLLWAARRAGMDLRMPRPRLTPGVRRLLRLMAPGILSAGAMQLNLLVGTMIATLQAGAVSYLYYADRLYQLPLGIIGIGIGIVLLPELARKLRGGLEEAAHASLNRALEFSLLLTLPATAALLLVPYPIISVLFERGAFDAEAARATAAALAAFALGLPAYVLVKVLQPPFFARQDTVTPLRFALASVVANLVLSLLLFFTIGFVGIALATAASSWLNVVLLGASLRKRGFLQLDARLRRRLPRSLLATCATGALLLLLNHALADLFAAGVPLRILALTILVLVGGGVYFLLAFALRAVERADLAAAFSRRAKTSSGA
ncbi:MAG TPA: murein biosynthesis integral membrane protein MurJ [Kiloniellales bacterium]|nr:murein biosynthesis integral membrane protein MurJ [Kiloniellales bacterium]